MARYVTKEFLSPSADETGSIVCQIETPLVKDISEYAMDNPWMRAGIKMTDCSKYINLDFDCHDQASFEKRLAKLDKIINEVQSMRNQYEAMWENNLRNVEHKRRSIAQAKIDAQKAKDDHARNYRGRV